MTVEDFLKNYDPKVQEVSYRLRDIVKEVMPDVNEFLFEGWKNIGYGIGENKSGKDMICYIAPFKDSVNLGFYRGAILNDEKNLLRGTGKLLRHIKIKELKQINDIDLKNILTLAKIERMGS
jgi:hypothetical protein